MKTNNTTTSTSTAPTEPEDTTICASDKSLGKGWTMAQTCDQKMADDACDVSVPPPDYNAIRARVVAPIRLLESQAIEEIEECFNVHCLAGAAHEIAVIRMKTNQEISRALEAAYRREEAIYEAKKAAKRTERLQTL